MKGTRITNLKEIGLKVTPQRQAILNLLQGNQNHPSAETIYSDISKRYPGISFATVYNTLSKLTDAGEIRELDIDPNKKGFDPCRTPHAHFYCKGCGEVFDIACDTSLPLNIKKIAGHYLDSIQLNFRGVCKDCRRKRRGK